MTGAELIEKIRENHLENCEIDTHPCIAFKVPKMWENRLTTRGYLWVEDDWYDDVRYNKEGDFTYGI